MSRWSQFGWYETKPKKPPPEDGIRMKKTGTTWWGKRWIEALENVLSGDSGRLGRGKTYARAGRVSDLVVKDGKVTAKVTGTGASPYKIKIVVKQFKASDWKIAIAAMASKAQFAAELLSGQMPQAIDEAFVEAGLSLFAKDRSDLETDCSCPDWGDPCKHVAATHYILGEALDHDPFLLFELRGMTKDQVLDALRAARGESVGTVPCKAASQRGPEVETIPAQETPTVKLGKLEEANYDRPRESLPAMHFSFDEPAMHAAVLRQLGAPAAWSCAAAPADVLAPMVRAAAEAARKIALAEVVEVPEISGEGWAMPNKTKKEKAATGPRRTAVKRKPA